MPAPEHEHARMAALLDGFWDKLHDADRWAYDDVPDDLVIREMSIVGIVEYSDPDDGESCEAIWMRFESSRRHVQRGIIEYARDRLINP